MQFKSNKKKQQQWQKNNTKPTENETKLKINFEIYTS